MLAILLHGAMVWGLWHHGPSRPVADTGSSRTVSTRVTLYLERENRPQAATDEATAVVRHAAAITLQPVRVKDGRVPSPVAEEAAPLVVETAKAQPLPTGGASSPLAGADKPLDLVLRPDSVRKGDAAPSFAAKAKSELGSDRPTDALQQGVQKSLRKDCREEQGAQGLLGISMIIKDALSDKGCKW